MTHLDYTPKTLEEAIYMLESKEDLLQDTLQRRNENFMHLNLALAKFAKFSHEMLSHRHTKLGEAVENWRKAELDHGPIQDGEETFDNLYYALERVAKVGSMHPILRDLRNWFNLPPF